MDFPEIFSHIVYAIGLVLTALLSGIAAWVSHKMHKSVEEVNDAVNHRHKKGGPDAPKLYDAMLSIHEKTDYMDKKIDEMIEWKRGYDEGPLDKGYKVEEFVKRVEDRFNSLEIRPPCAIHNDRLDLLMKLVELHTDELNEDQD